MTPAQSIAAIIGHEPAPGDTLDDLGLDLIDLWRVRDDLERAHGIEIACHDMMRWRVVGDICEAVKLGVDDVRRYA